MSLRVSAALISALAFGATDASAAELKVFSDTPLAPALRSGPSIEWTLNFNIRSRTKAEHLTRISELLGEPLRSNKWIISFMMAVR